MLILDDFGTKLSDGSKPNMEGKLKGIKKPFISHLYIEQPI